MSDNPFKLIRSTDQPPEALRREVMTSVKFAMLLMRFVQLFVADFSVAIFDKVRKAGDDKPTTRGNTPSPHGS